MVSLNGGKKQRNKASLKKTAFNQKCHVLQDKTGAVAGDVLSLSEARYQITGNPSHSTLWRWAVHGLNGVKLRTVRIGKRIFTSREAINEFLSAFNRG